MENPYCSCKLIRHLGGGQAGARGAAGPGGRQQQHDQRQQLVQQMVQQIGPLGPLGMLLVSAHARPPGALTTTPPADRLRV